MNDVRQYNRRVGLCIHALTLCSDTFIELGYPVRLELQTQLALSRRRPTLAGKIRHWRHRHSKEVSVNNGTTTQKKDHDKS